MNTFNLQIVSLDSVFYDGPCESLTIPAVDGEKGIMAGHEPMVMAITAGELHFTTDDQQQKMAAVVITDFAQTPEEIDVERAERAKASAEEKLREKKTQLEFVHSQAKLARAMARLKVAKKGAARR